jgi:hypothetical protein
MVLGTAGRSRVCHRRCAHRLEVSEPDPDGCVILNRLPHWINRDRAGATGRRATRCSPNVTPLRESCEKLAVASRSREAKTNDHVLTTPQSKCQWRLRIRRSLDFEGSLDSLTWWSSESAGTPATGPRRFRREVWTAWPGPSSCHPARGSDWSKRQASHRCPGHSP